MAEVAVVVVGPTHALILPRAPVLVDHHAVSRTTHRLLAVVEEVAENPVMGEEIRMGPAETLAVIVEAVGIAAVTLGMAVVTLDMVAAAKTATAVEVVIQVMVVAILATEAVTAAAILVMVGSKE